MVYSLRDRILAGPHGVERPLTEDEMRAFAAEVDLDGLDLSDCCGFRDECYARNTVHLNDHFELVVICWKPGQMSAVHDHGVSRCLYRVVRGTMTEERYERGDDGDPRPTDERTFGPGDITLALGDEIHRISNRGDEDLVTIHIYSPPLGEAARMFTPIPRTATPGS